MKRKLTTLALVASITSTAFAGFSAPLPEFKNEKQLAEWRAEMAAKNAVTTTTNEESAFYTGKPYVESTGSYAFKYRSYNPDLARWTSEDPSGFPDGANGNTFSCNTPLNGLDPDGLMFFVYESGSLQEWSGTGWKDGKTAPKSEWGEKTNSWGACSGGAEDKAPIDKGWWKLAPSVNTNLGVRNDSQSESDYKISSTWHQGAMSLWKGKTTGDNVQVNNDNHIQYKWGLSAMTDRNNNSGRTGIAIHPDGPNPNETHGCIGILDFADAGTVLKKLGGSLTLLVE